MRKSIKLKVKSLTWDLTTWAHLAPTYSFSAGQYHVGGSLSHGNELLKTTSVCLAKVHISCYSHSSTVKSAGWASFMLHITGMWWMGHGFNFRHQHHPFIRNHNNNQFIPSLRLMQDFSPWTLLQHGIKDAFAVGSCTAYIYWSQPRYCKHH